LIAKEYFVQIKKAAFNECGFLVSEEIKSEH